MPETIETAYKNPAQAFFNVIDKMCLLFQHLIYMYKEDLS